MLSALALALHALSAVVWVGGMAFAYLFVRPALGALEGPQRQTLWRGTFARFFPVVWGTVGLLLLTGYYMVFGTYGGFANVGVHVHIMHLLGLVMMAIFAHVFFAPWRRFAKAVDAGDRETAAQNIETIRKLVALNLTLGVIVVVVASGGRFWG
ncbi:CopD family protein [Rhodovibrio salinarum]|nr:CopD family protein [Rhodovibrio salinarum]